MFMEETLGKRINIDRAEEILATGMRTAVAACPFCVTMLTDGISDCGGVMHVKDIAEIVDEATA
jgi:Fe-S oxidoreductase